jgi:hypothetical protein
VAALAKLVLRLILSSAERSLALMDRNCSSKLTSAPPLPSLLPPAPLLVVVLAAAAAPLPC